MRDSSTDNQEDDDQSTSGSWKGKGISIPEVEERILQRHADRVVDDTPIADDALIAMEETKQAVKSQFSNVREAFPDQPLSLWTNLSNNAKKDAADVTHRIQQLEQNAKITEALVNDLKMRLSAAENAWVLLNDDYNAMEVNHNKIMKGEMMKQEWTILQKKILARRFGA